MYFYYVSNDLFGGVMMEYNATQIAILRTVFHQMDRELGIRPLTDEQLKEFAPKLEEKNETDE